jgi:hypothetical protein
MSILFQSFAGDLSMRPVHLRTAPATTCLVSCSSSSNSLAGRTSWWRALGPIDATVAAVAGNRENRKSKHHHWRLSMQQQHHRRDLPRQRQWRQQPRVRSVQCPSAAAAAAAGTECGSCGSSSRRCTAPISCSSRSGKASSSIETNSLIQVHLGSVRRGYEARLSNAAAEQEASSIETNGFGQVHSVQHLHETGSVVLRADYCWCALPS